ncbi:alpha/beta fold hydrolase [Caulobacter sp.]|uniref:alpha/beta fold hydrolase n=1 Tax=Caulobacter sp. TaxID=78 RepID=UPI003BA9B824
MARVEIRACDLTLVADIEGPEGAPTVVLLHGGGQTRHSWADAMRALAARGYRVISYDARGHGDSGWSAAGAYRLDDRAEDLAAVLHGTRASFALVGASLGGATAIQAAARGLRPAALALVDIVPDAEPQGVARIVNFMRGNPGGFASLKEAVDAVAAYNPERPRPSDPTGLMRNLRRGDDGRLRWHWDPRIVEAEPQVHHDEVRRSARILSEETTLPVLLVRGLRSDVVSDAGVEAFRRMMPRLAVDDVAGAGHMVAGDRNDAFNASVLKFLDRHMPVPGVRA